MLTSEHADLLKRAAITPDVITRTGIHSITTTDELPPEFATYGTTVLPALAFPYGDTTQIRPDNPPMFDGKPSKYLWPKGHPLVLATRRDPKPDSPILIVEGTKQALSAASYAPDGFGVIGMVGCRGWYQDGAPNPDLAIVDGRDVFIILDSDAATNHDVYTAGAGLADACEMEGAQSVRFVRLIGGRKAGLDDILGGRQPDRRAAYLERLITASKTKPADSKPKPNRKRTSNTPEVTPDRAAVVVNGDRWEVINELTDALLRRWDATRLFNYGGIISQRRDNSMVPVPKDAFNDVIAETCMTVHKSGDGDDATYTHGWPDPQTTGAVLSRADRFAKLDKLAQTPFIRPDGTVCATGGYDANTRTFLTLDQTLTELEVPEHPTPAHLHHAVTLLLGELLEGFPFPTDADRANALATLLTPFVRSLVPVSPLAVIDGKEAGSGKNLFADVVSILATGRAAQPLPYTTDDAEQRKVITSAFRAGTNLFIFDEAHRIEGASFARALTSHTYQDRVLGVSNLAEFPNNVTWISLGNQVQVIGDMGRRAYRVRLEYRGASPENRPETDFRHPDLREWSTGMRRELVTACLTLVRAWFAEGRPKAPLGFRMGSFEAWQSVLAGVLHVANVPGFLDGMREWRSESDFERQHWTAHLAWLYATFGDREFTASEVVRKLREDRNAEHPHGMDDPTREGYTRLLGQAYARQRDRWLDGYRLRKTEGPGSTAHKKTIKWVMDGPDGDPFNGPIKIGDTQREATEVTEVTPTPRALGETYTFSKGTSTTSTNGGCEGVLTENTRVSPKEEGRGVPSVTSVTSVTSGLAPVLPPALAALVDEPRLYECDRCGQTEETFGYARILRACRQCYPATFLIKPAQGTMQ